MSFSLRFQEMIYSEPPSASLISCLQCNRATRKSSSTVCQILSLQSHPSKLHRPSCFGYPCMKLFLKFIPVPSTHLIFLFRLSVCKCILESSKMWPFSVLFLKDFFSGTSTMNNCEVTTLQIMIKLLFNSLPPLNRQFCQLTFEIVSYLSIFIQSTSLFKIKYLREDSVNKRL